MPDRSDTELDKQLSAISADFVQRIDAIAAGPFLRAGILNAAISDLVWSIFYDLPDLRHDLVDALEGLPEAVRDAIAEARTPST